MIVAVLGTGTMGAPMARNLAEAGFEVRVWNRTIEKARAVEGARACETAAEAADGADFLLTMLSDGDAVEEAVSGGVLDGNAVWLQMSTVGLDATERLMKLADDSGTPFVDAPVVGTKQPAEKGELTILAPALVTRASGRSPCSTRSAPGRSSSARRGTARGSSS